MLRICNLIAANLDEAVCYTDYRFSYIQKQHNEYFCGVSIIKALVSLCLEIDVEQEDIFSLVMMNASAKQSSGISFLDMKNCLMFFSINSDGFKVNNPEMLSSLFYSSKFPIVCHTLHEGSGHFVLLVEIVDDFFVILDPAYGTRLLSNRDFFKEWTGNMLMVNGIDSNISCKWKEQYTSQSDRIAFLAYCL